MSRVKFCYRKGLADVTGKFWLSSTAVPHRHSSSQLREPSSSIRAKFQDFRLFRVQQARVITMSNDAVDLQKTDPNLSPPTPKLILYSFWQSSCAWRVRFALNVKGIPYEYRSVNLEKGEQFSPEFEKLNPLHYVPVVVDGDVVVSDSYAILLYLEEKYPGKALLPVDPKLRAINLQAASVVGSSIQPLHMMAVTRSVEEKFGSEVMSSWVQFHIEKGFLALEKLLEKYAAKYATGNEVTLADVFLAPQIAAATQRFNIDMSKFRTLSKIFDSYMALPEFEASFPQRQPDAAES